MGESNASISAEHPDDALLIDYHLGQCDPTQRKAVEARLIEDGQFARRHEKVRALFGLLDADVVEEPPQALLARTLKAVESAQRTTALIDREAVRGRPLAFPTFSIKELGALAAMLLIGVLILLPSWRRAQDLSAQQACLARAGEIGNALRQYAIANNDVMPGMGLEQAAWLPGPAAPTVSNSQNLWKLVRGQYARPTMFQCPAVGGERDLAYAAHMADFPDRQYVSYSYQNTVNAQPLQIDMPAKIAAQMAILADRTPVFDGDRFQADQVNAQNSPNHGRRGQSVLYLDGHAAWATHAAVGVEGDNIWLVQGVQTYRGVERPASSTDSFMLPSYVRCKP